MRRHCIAMHEEIRQAIRAVLVLAQRAMNGDGSVALPLERAMQKLAYSVRRHVVAEQRDTDEALQQLETWAADRRQLLVADHERELEAVFNVEYYGSHLAMAQDAAAIANELLESLRHEEEVALPAEPVAGAAYTPQQASARGEPT